MARTRRCGRNRRWRRRTEELAPTAQLSADLILIDGLAVHVSRPEEETLGQVVRGREGA